MKPRLLFLVSEDWYFYSHRLDLAKFARDVGFDVFVATRVSTCAAQIEKEGIKVLAISLIRRSWNPVREIKSIVELISLYRRIKPDLVHHVALKPVLYGFWAARFARVPAVVNAFGGLGYVFIANGLGARVFRSFLGSILRWVLAHPGSRVILQNKEDLAQFVNAGVVRPSQAVVIRGAGVDISAFVPLPEADGDVVVVLASRMLWDKGVGEFVEAARILKSQSIHVRTVLVGILDEENPRHIPESQFLAWQREGVIEWWGRREDMAHVFAISHIVVLPTYYGEGLPKVLLEAAACARPIVTTQIRGCREVVRDGDNGFLVPPKDPRALAEAIATLVRNPELRIRMGARGRQIVVEEFTVEKVARETLAVYGELLGTRWPHAKLAVQE